jgi:hypothetical protein
MQSKILNPPSLGYHKVEIFRHVTGSTLMSAEPGNDKRWVQVRANAGKIDDIDLDVCSEQITKFIP